MSNHWRFSAIVLGKLQLFILISLEKPNNIRDARKPNDSKIRLNVVTCSKCQLLKPSRTLLDKLNTYVETPQSLYAPNTHLLFT
jgi:hypothetical protein